jgi:hypothetical protein
MRRQRRRERGDVGGDIVVKCGKSGVKNGASAAGEGVIGTRVDVRGAAPSRRRFHFESLLTLDHFGIGVLEIFRGEIWE